MSSNVSSLTRDGLETPNAPFVSLLNALRAGKQNISELYGEVDASDVKNRNRMFVCRETQSIVVPFFGGGGCFCSWGVAGVFGGFLFLQTKKVSASCGSTLLQNIHQGKREFLLLVFTACTARVFQMSCYRLTSKRVFLIFFLRCEVWT